LCQEVGFLKKDESRIVMDGSLNYLSQKHANGVKYIFELREVLYNCGYI
jgi:hypothetical protein